MRGMGINGNCSWGKINCSCIARVPLKAESEMRIWVHVVYLGGDLSREGEVRQRREGST